MIPHELVAEVGDIVDWYPDGEMTVCPIPALVTKKGMGSQLNVNVLDPALRNFSIFEGCKHVHDPGAKDSERKDYGAWKHTTKTLMIRRLLIAAGLLAVGDNYDLVYTAPASGEKSAPAVEPPSVATPAVAPPVEKKVEKPSSILDLKV